MSEQSAEVGLEQLSGAEVGGSTQRVVIITGMSGSGKSTVMRALEDVGFFCIDNLPVPLLPKVLELASGRGEGMASQPYAFVVDMRAAEFLDGAGEVIDQLLSEGVQVQVIFLEADDDTLVRRYSETRRRHPMSEGGTVRDGIARERARLTPLRARADLLIDTTAHTVHSLKALIQEQVAVSSSTKLSITMMSFGFKYGLPSECDLVFDVRFLPNPYFVEELRPRTGEDVEVANYVLGFPQTNDFMSLFLKMAEFLLPQYEREGKSYVTIGIGCTGGKHRSVAVSRALARRLLGKGWAVDVRHRDARRSGG